jgi:excisionase family DNA binding protein
MINPFENLDRRQSNIENILLCINKTISELKANFEPKQPTELLTRTQVSELLKCDLSTIHNWCKKGKLTPYGIGNRIYFKRSEIEAVLIPLGQKKGGKSE